MLGPATRDRGPDPPSAGVAVRTPQEYAEGHAPGAINIPVTELAERHHQLRKCGAVIVYCHSGTRSGWAQRLLHSRGHQVIDVGTLEHARSVMAAAPLPNRRPNCVVKRVMPSSRPGTP